MGAGVGGSARRADTMEALVVVASGRDGSLAMVCADLCHVRGATTTDLWFVARCLMAD